MADKKMYIHLNMMGNQIMNGAFEQLATAPASPVLGQQYWNTTTGAEMIWDGSAWQDILGLLTLNANANTPALTVDTVTTPGTAILAIADADGTNSGLLSSTKSDLLDTATDAGTNDALVLRDATGSFTATAVTITGTPTNGTDAATKAYVDGVINSGMTVKGGLDASTNPNYPAAVVGDAYYVTADGRVGGATGEIVNTGDLVLCTTDNAGGDETTVGGNWIVLERNLDIATTTTAGTTRLATPAEVTAGTATDAVPTIADVTSMVNASTTGSFISNLAAGSTSYTVNHALGAAVICQVYDKTTGAYVEVDITYVDANNVTVTVNAALVVDHVVMCTYAGVQPA